MGRVSSMRRITIDTLDIGFGWLENSDVLGNKGSNVDEPEEAYNESEVADSNDMSVLLGKYDECDNESIDELELCLDADEYDEDSNTTDTDILDNIEEASDELIENDLENDLENDDDIFAEELYSGDDENSLENSSSEKATIENPETVESSDGSRNGDIDIDEDSNLLNDELMLDEDELLIEDDDIENEEDNNNKKSIQAEESDDALFEDSIDFEEEIEDYTEDNDDAVDSNNGLLSGNNCVEVVDDTDIEKEFNLEAAEENTNEVKYESNINDETKHNEKTSTVIEDANELRLREIEARERELALKEKELELRRKEIELEARFRKLEENSRKIVPPGENNNMKHSDIKVSNVPTDKNNVEQKKSVDNKTVEEKKAPNKPDFSNMTDKKLWVYMKAYLEKMGVNKEPVSAARLCNMFGADNVRRMRNRGYIIAVGSAYTYGANV